VKCFQQHNGLTVDGTVGPNTWKALQHPLIQDPNNCDPSAWCYYKYPFTVDQFRVWGPSGIWYVVGLSNTYVQVNLNGPN